jgi:hypothetical protein
MTIWQCHASFLMNPYTKAAVFLIRLIAFGCILCSLLLLGSNLFLLMTGKKSEDGMLSMALKSLPFIVGLLLLIKSYAIARKLTEDFDP